MFTSIRALVYLRQIARELKRANDLAEVRLALEYPAWGREHKVRTGRTARVASISVASVEDWNKRYRDQHGVGTDE